MKIGLKCILHIYLMRVFLNGAANHYPRLSWCYTLNTQSCVGIFETSGNTRNSRFYPKYQIIPDIFFGLPATPWFSKLKEVRYRKRFWVASRIWVPVGHWLVATKLVGLLLDSTICFFVILPAAAAAAAAASAGRVAAAAASAASVGWKLRWNWEIVEVW